MLCQPGAWSWLRTPLVPVLWVKGAEQVPTGQRAPPLWGRGCWASRNLWSGFTLAVASDCRLSAGEEPWRLSLTEEEAGAQRGRGAGPGPHGEATATPGALEKGASGEVEVPGEVGVSVVGVGRVLWVPLGQEPVSPHRVCRVGSWSMPSVPAAAGPRGAGPLLSPSHAPGTSSCNCVWRVNPPISLVFSHCSPER